MSKSRQLMLAAARHPLLWGTIATMLFYFGLDAGLVSDPLALRYLTGHWAAYVCTTMFLVGLSATVIKAVDLVNEKAALASTLFEGLPARDLPITDAALLRQRLDSQPAKLQSTYLLGRLRAAVEYLARKGSTEDLEDELRSLAELDADRKHSSYGIVRMMLWAMPFVGSLGTVVGIGQAIANLGPEVSVSSVAAVTPGLELVFDTTALALLWSVLLMMAMFVADHFECRLLAAVDARTNLELVGRFRGTAGAGGGGSSSAGMNDAVVDAMEKMGQRQSELWQASLDAATKHWEEQTELLKKQFETSGSGSGSGGGHGPALAGGGAIDASQLQQALLQSAGLAGMHHGDLAGHSEIVRELGEVLRQESRNWPVRKALRRNTGASSTPAADAGTDWLERS